MARSYAKVAKPYCDPPANYSGPLYYRVQANATWPHPTWFWLEESEKKRQSEVGYQNPASDHFPLDRLTDKDGVLLTEWRTPQKYHYRPEKMPYEFHSRIISERIRDVIEELAPKRHIFLPLDFTASDGKVSRWYLRIWRLTALSEDDLPPALHPDLNELRTHYYTNGKMGFVRPEWAWCSSSDISDFDHFGYLNETVVVGLHLFEVGLLDNRDVLSAELFERLCALGDNVLHRRDDYVPIGSAPYTPPPGGYRVPDNQPKRESLMERWIRLTIPKR